MKAHCKLWIDTKGTLCENPPETGELIAAFCGDEIREETVSRYDLIREDEKVVQKKLDGVENKMRGRPKNKGGLKINTKRHEYNSGSK